MVLEFESEYGQKRVIGNPQNFEEVVSMCRDFLNSIPSFKVYYWEWQLGKDMWILDFGSYRSFIILTQVYEGLEQELSDFYSKGEENGNVSSRSEFTD